MIRKTDTANLTTLRGHPKQKPARTQLEAELNKRIAEFIALASTQLPTHLLAPLPEFSDAEKYLAEGGAYTNLRNNVRKVLESK